MQKEKIEFEKLDNLHISISKNFKLQEGETDKFLHQLR